MADVSWSDPHGALADLSERQLPHWESYLGFYSSWLKGYFREPWAMLIPMDDHGFHRGDGVFEAVRLFDRALIDLRAHLNRLENSAKSLGMTLPQSVEELAEIAVNLARRCDTPSGILRLYVTRGPGGFSPSPREVIGAQIYMAITRLRPPTAEQYQAGVTAMFTQTAAKEPFWARIKSCNYLQNVLMKQECLAKGFDFPISLDSHGRVCEGSTENLMVVGADRILRIPRFDYTLSGTTVSVVMKLAQNLVQAGRLVGVEFADLKKSDLLAAREMAFVGTTLGVLPVRQVEDQIIGSGSVGDFCRELQGQLLHAWATQKDLRTPF